MRRTIALLTTMAMTLLVATSVAVAGNVFCTDIRPCYGTDLDDYIEGDPGGNDIFAKGGKDQVIAFGGTNRLYGGDGNDFLGGENGNDTMYGNAGNDTMGGYGGTDTYLFEDGWGVDTIKGDASGYDTLDFSKLTKGVVVRNNSAKSGTNTLNWDSTGLVERIIGGAGKDILNGSNVGTSLYGAAGQDYLTGGYSKDTLVGGAGTDYFAGASGDDTIRADDGETDQLVVCGAGSDTVYYDRTRDFPDQFRDCENKKPVPS